jgi:hypothetical protein
VGGALDLGVIERDGDVVVEVKEVLEYPAGSRWHWRTALRGTMARNAGNAVILEEMGLLITKEAALASKMG